MSLWPFEPNVVANPSESGDWLCSGLYIPGPRLSVFAHDASLSAHVGQCTSTTVGSLSPRRRTRGLGGGAVSLLIRRAPACYDPSFQSVTCHVLPTASQAARNLLGGTPDGNLGEDTQDARPTDQ